MQLGLHYAVLMPLALTVVTLAGLLLATRGNPIAQRIWKPTLTLILAAWLVYMMPFATLDFRLAEVAKNSSSDLSLPIRIATSWSGGGSSLFFFTTVTALGLLLATRREGTLPKTMLVGGYGLLFVGLLSALLNGAFDVVEGVGGLDLNPLLKSYWIIPHPLSTFGGYALILAGALGVMTGLGKRAAPILLAGWALLTLGIAFGGYWSYETFGWGGYWAWDPVEVAELTVWLASTTVLHMMGPLQPLRAPFAAMAVGSVPLALYVTRSGLSPLHNFAAAEVGAVVLLATSLVFLGVSLTMLAREEVAGQVFAGLRKTLAEKRVPLIALVVGAFAIMVMNVFVYASLLTPSLLTAVGKSANIPTMAEGVRFYHPVLYPLAMILVAALPGYFLSRHLGALEYLGLLALGLALGGVTAAAVYRGYLVFSPLESTVTNLKIALGVPLIFVMLGGLASSLLLEARRNVKQGLRKAHLVRDSGLKLLHMGVLVTLLGILLSGGYSFNDQYFQTYNLLPGETIEFGSLRITLSNYTYYPAGGTVDLYSHVSGKLSTALVAWQALNQMATSLPTTLEQVRLAGSSEEGRGIARDIVEALSHNGPLGGDWLNTSLRGSIMAASVGSGNTTTLSPEGEITMSLENPEFRAELRPIITGEGGVQGAWLSVSLRGSTLVLTPVEGGLEYDGRPVLLLNLTTPLRIGLGNLVVKVDKAMIIQENEPDARFENNTLILSNPVLVVTQGNLEVGGRDYQLPYELGRGLYLYILTQRGDDPLLGRLLESRVSKLVGDPELLKKATGSAPGEVALPKQALSGVRLALDFVLEDSSKNERWTQTALVRFEANGEAIGIHGLVTDVIIIKRGLNDIYISVQPPIVEGEFNAYHELLIYYIKEALGRLPPEQALSLAGVMAAGYNVASLTTLSPVDAARLVEQSMIELLLMAEDFNPANSTLANQGLPVLIKVVPNINLLWLGVALMSASALVLAVGQALSQRRGV